MQTLLEGCLANVLVATALALGAAGLRPFCRRPALLHLLWLLVLLKLITPPIVTIPFSIPAMLQPVRTEALALRFGGESLERHTPVVTDATANREERATEEAAWEDLVALSETGETEESLTTLPGGVEEPASPAAGISLDKAFWLPGVFSCWLAGILVLFAVAGFRIARFHRLLGASRPAPAPLQEQARQLAQRLGMTRCPTVWMVSGCISPLLWPFGARARLVMPVGLMERLSPEQQMTLLAHELAHARRHDHWVRWLELVVTSLYWWFPLAWWTRRQLQQAEEQCCDAWVVWMLPAAAKAYAKALLQTVEYLDARPALPPAASGIGHVCLLKRRLTMILREPSCPQAPWPLRLGIWLVGMLILSIAPHCLAARSSADEPAALVVEKAAVVLAEPEDQKSDLEQRLRKLEDRMERVLKALEPRSKTPRENSQQAEEQRRQAEEKARQARQRAEERRRQVQEEQRKNQAEQRKRRELRGREQTKPETEKDAKRLGDNPKNLLNPSQTKELERQIHDLVAKAMNPERMKELQQQIQETVNKNLNADKMKELEQKIRELVNRSVDPKRLEALAKQIETNVKRSVESVQREQMRQLKKPSDKARTPEARPAASAPQQQDKSQVELERRLDRLEERMDRVLRALEKSSK